MLRESKTPNLHAELFHRHSANPILGQDFVFEGYRVWQLPSQGGFSNAKVIATFDQADAFDNLYSDIFNPQVVIVGGGAIAAGELLLAPARDMAARRALPRVWEGVRVVPARFGAESGMLGAAALAMEGLDGAG